ncbi:MULTISPECIES: helix-turn-helix transcriptional regulator [Rheinheimera]|uniref:Helix-turn-helix transcriptional regulator n=1 Tax=Rheinheimera marina TaxID=1774958 RepID=A0ABV9JPI7_9GAMM
MNQPIKHYRSTLGLTFDAQMSTAFCQLWRQLGAVEFPVSVMDVLEAVCPTDSCGILVYYRQRKPMSLLHRFNPVERKVPADIYSTGPYALDPQYLLFLSGCPTGAYWLRDVAPDDFYSSEYYQTFYSQTGVADSIDVLWRIDDDSALVFFMQRNVHSPEFCQADLTALTMVLPMLSEALTRHYQLHQPLPQQSSEDKTHQQVECTLNHFASSLLTKRERDVLLYMLRGYSSALTAEKLNTSDGTVKIHRKNIYRKLDIGSQAELFSLFISCIPYARPDEATDPLLQYQSSKATTA